MKILLIASSYSEIYEETLSSQCVGESLLFAANTFQNSVIDGLLSNNADFEVLSFPALPCYPFRFKRPYTKRLKYIVSGREVGLSEKYCTAIVLKGFSIKFRARKSVIKWIKRNNICKNDVFSIILYQPSPYINSMLASLKKKYINMKIVTIVADFYSLEAEIQYAKQNYGFLKLVQAYYECTLMQKYYRTIDKFVLLTNAMQDGIPESKGKSIVIEGLANSQWISTQIIEKKDKIRTVVYTGQLGPNSGIDALVDAFMKVTNQDIRLIITGEGSLANYVVEKSNIDKRIIYLGIVSRNKMIDLQRKATLLVNPRRPSTNMTKYSFPSKIMEYMAAITPVLTFRLEGIPDEYFNYCYCVEQDTIDSFAESITYIMTLPQDVLDKKASEAMLFLKSNKTSQKQIRKLLDFIQE